jgi:hypothetical protein
MGGTSGRHAQEEIRERKDVSPLRGAKRNEWRPGKEHEEPSEKSGSQHSDADLI